MSSLHNVSAKGRHLLSCLQCRKKKTKCDRKLQCGNCTRQGVLCEWREGIPPKSKNDLQLEEAHAEINRLQLLLASLLQYLENRGDHFVPFERPLGTKNEESGSHARQGYTYFYSPGSDIEDHESEREEEETPSYPSFPIPIPPASDDGGSQSCSVPTRPSTSFENNDMEDKFYERDLYSLLNAIVGQD